jgi:hypothetical protein
MSFAPPPQILCCAPEDEQMLNDLIQRARTAQMQSPWTPERIELLEKMVASGASAGEIARSLQCGRGAITGKCARMGLHLNGKRVGAALEHTRGSRRPRGQQAGAEPIEPIEPPEMRCVELMELGPGECKWPITEGPPHRFCGCEAASGHVYCGWHCARAYRGESIHERIDG